MSSADKKHRSFTDFYREARHPFVINENFLEAESAEILYQKVQSLHGKASAQEKPQAWVLDLDSTLFCTADRNREIFKAFLEFKKDVPSAWQKAVEHFSQIKQSFNIRESLEWALIEVLSQDEAYKESKKIWADFQSFWEHHFFSSQFMPFDVPYGKAVEFVNKIWNDGYHVVYVTGRDTARSLEGTINSFKQWGFPHQERTELILKPGFRWSMTDVEFKVMAAEKVASRYEVLCSIDNEPENVHAFARFFPKSEIALFHSVMSERSPQTPIQPHLENRKLWLLKNF